MRVPGQAEPRFDLDYAYGREGEIQIDQLLQWIVSGNGQVEVKRKSYLDLNFYVETHCDKGLAGVYQPSGISVTTASVWAFVLGDTGISVLVPSDTLRAMLDDASSEDKEETHGSCPTRGKLIRLAVLLYRCKQQRDRQTRQRASVPATLPEKITKPIDAPFGLDLTGRPLAVRPGESKNMPGTGAPKPQVMTADEINWGFSS